MKKDQSLRLISLTKSYSFVSALLILLTTSTTNASGMAIQNYNCATQPNSLCKSTKSNCDLGLQVECRSAQNPITGKFFCVKGNHTFACN